MRRLLLFTLTVCMAFATVSAFAGSGDEVLTETHAEFYEDTEIIARIPINNEPDGINGELRDSQLQEATNGFSLAEDGTLFVLNHNAPNPVIKVYSNTGEFLYDISCIEIAQEESDEEHDPGYCPIADIQYYGGYLFAMAYYYYELPALIKYSIADKTAEKLPIPTDFLDSLHEHSGFHRMFVVKDNIVMQYFYGEHLTYSATESEFLTDTVVSVTMDEEQNSATVKCGDYTYTIDTSYFSTIDVFGQTKNGNIFADVYYGDDFAQVQYTPNGEYIGQTFHEAKNIRRGWRTFLKVVNDSLYCICEDTDFVYVYKADMNEEYVATGPYDINGDGAENTADAVVLLKCSAGIIDYEHSREFIKADVNMDYVFNTADAVAVLKKCAE